MNSGPQSAASGVSSSGSKPNGDVSSVNAGSSKLKSSSVLWHGIYHHQVASSATASLGLLTLVRAVLFFYALAIVICHSIYLRIGMTGAPIYVYFSSYTLWLITLYLLLATCYSLAAWHQQRKMRRGKDFIDDDDLPSDTEEDIFSKDTPPLSQSSLDDGASAPRIASSAGGESSSLLQNGNSASSTVTRRAKKLTDDQIRLGLSWRESRWHREQGSNIKFGGKLTYVLFEVAFSWSIISSLMHWILEYPTVKASNKPTSTAELVILFHIHGIIVAWMMLDLVLNRITFKHLHLIFSLVSAIIYFIINALYVNISNTNVYDILTWKDGRTALVIFVVLLSLTVSFYLGFVLSQVRDRCTQRHFVYRSQPIKANSSEQLEDDEDEPCPQPAFVDVKPIKGGALWKRGSRTRSWNKRLAVIEGKFLYYYLHEKDNVPRGVISLIGCKVKEEPEVGKEKGLACFSINTPKAWNIDFSEKYYGRKYFFCCDSPGEMSEWMAVINRSSSWA